MGFFGSYEWFLNGFMPLLLVIMLLLISFMSCMLFKTVYQNKSGFMWLLGAVCGY